jgi:hypothetical protein
VAVDWVEGTGGDEGGVERREETRALKTGSEEKQNRFLGNETASPREQPDVIRAEQ